MYQILFKYYLLKMWLNIITFDSEYKFWNLGQQQNKDSTVSNEFNGGYSIWRIVPIYGMIWIWNVYVYEEGHKIQMASHIFWLIKNQQYQIKKLKMDFVPYIKCKINVHELKWTIRTFIDRVYTLLESERTIRRTALRPRFLVR